MSAFGGKADIEAKLLTKDEALIAANIAKLPVHFANSLNPNRISTFHRNISNACSLNDHDPNSRFQPRNGPLSGSHARSGRA
jgi:hypothetical protein